jgi:phi13 family phage major tail protein
MPENKKNKVKFNIRNAHVALKKVDDLGKITYDTPFAVPGSVSVSLEPQGELTPFYADGIKYYVSASNGGYEGDWELALVTDEFRQKILNECIDKNKVMLESGDSKINEFAFGFEIDGDQRGTRFWFYSCSATRPTTESNTNEDTIEPVTDKLTISASAAPVGTDGKMYIRAKTTAESDEALFHSWFDKVYIADQEAA